MSSACPYTKPSHYVNQCWIIVNWTLRNKLQWNLNRNSNIFIEKMRWKVSSAKRRPFCLGLNVLNQPSLAMREIQTKNSGMFLAIFSNRVPLVSTAKPVKFRHHADDMLKFNSPNGLGCANYNESTEVQLRSWCRRSKICAALIC